MTTWERTTWRLSRFEQRLGARVRGLRCYRGALRGSVLYRAPWLALAALVVSPLSQARSTEQPIEQSTERTTERSTEQTTGQSRDSNTSAALQPDMVAGGANISGAAIPPAPFADRQLADPRREAEARALMVTLRCPVCQGQSIADSDAPLAGDMRHHVRLKIAEGQSPEQVRDWLIARYGRWVSYDPPLDGLSAPLWYAPLVFLLFALAVAAQLYRKRHGKAASNAGDDVGGDVGEESRL